MAKFYYRYGCMNSSKSLNLLATAHNYKTQGKEVLLIKPSLDIRSATSKIESRIGLSVDCLDIDSNSDLMSYFLILIHDKKKFDCILIDEAQFLTKEQVQDLAWIVDKFDIPCIAYGLKNSYLKGELFEGSQALLYFADKIEEIKTTCSCGSKATMNLRVLNGEPVYEGQVINCGDIEQGEDYYIPVCRKHYFNPELKN